MTIQAQTPDGIIHEFPDGTPDDIVDNAVKDYLYKPPDAVRAAYQGAMDTVAKPVNSVVNNAMGVVAQTEAPAAQSVANAIDSTGAGQWVGDKLMAAKNYVSDAFAPIINNVKDLESYNPDLRKDLGAFGENADLAANIPIVRGATNAARSAITDLTQPSYDSLAASRSAQVAAKQAAQNEPFLRAKANNVNYVEGLNANAENLKQTYGDIYDKAGEISQGVVRNEPGIQKNVSALLDNLKDDPAHQGAQGTSQAYRDLTAVNNSFDENGDIPLDSITLLQRRVNDLYSPDMAGDRKVIYNALNTQLKQATARAMEDNPEWATLMGSGNKLFANFKDTYVNDPKTDGIWSLEDKANYEKANATNADPYGAGMPTTTRDKLYNLPNNVKSLAQYESMLRKLPPELQESFTNDVVAATKEDAPNLSGRIYAAYKAAKGNPYYTVQTVKNIYNAMTKTDGSINPSVANPAPHVNDAINYYSKLSDAAYNGFKNRPNNGALRLPAPIPPVPPPSPESPPIYMRDVTPRLPAPPDVSVNKVGTASIPATSFYDQPRGATEIPSAGTGRSPGVYPSPPPSNALPAPSQGSGFIAGKGGVRPRTQAETFNASDEALKQKDVVWDAQAAHWRNMGYNQTQIEQKLGARPSTAAQGDSVLNSPGAQTLQDIAKGKKRGGRVLTPIQRQAVNKIVKKTQSGRAA